MRGLCAMQRLRAMVRLKSSIRWPRDANGHRTRAFASDVNLTGTSRATAYRELTVLTEQGLLERTGQGRGTRYVLVMPQKSVIKG